MSDNEEEKKGEDLTISNEIVRNKYKAAATVVNDVLKLLCLEVKPGKVPSELCTLGDKTMTAMLANVFNKQDNGPEKINRGIAFPTCINVNEIVCHYSPVPEGETPLKVGDIVKIDLGAHVDGFPAVVAYTIVVQDEVKPITGRLADLTIAAQTMLEVAARCLKPGKKNNDIPPLLEKIADAFGVTICEGVLSHQMKRFVLDGNQSILSKASVERKVEDISFTSGQVWTLDVLLSAGKGKLHEEDSRCCIFKRNPDQQYMLKLKASKDAFREITTRFPTFPFTIRDLDSKSGRLGVNECLKHELIVPYPVLYERPGVEVVHFKQTVFVCNNIEMVTGLELQQEFVSEKRCEDPQVQEVLQTPLASKKKQKPKKKWRRPTEG